MAVHCLFSDLCSSDPGSSGPGSSSPGSSAPGSSSSGSSSPGSSGPGSSGPGSSGLGIIIAQFSFEDVFFRVVAIILDFVCHSSVFVLFLLRCSIDGLHK